MARKQIIRMRKRGYLRDEFDIALPGPTHQVRHFSLFQYAAIGGILVWRVLIFSVRPSRAVAPAVGKVLEKLQPSRIDLGMTVQPHASIELHEQVVVFVQSREVAHEPLEKWNILMARQIKLN